MSFALACQFQISPSFATVAHAASSAMIETIRRLLREVWEEFAGLVQAALRLIEQFLLKNSQYASISLIHFQVVNSNIRHFGKLYYIL